MPAHVWFFVTAVEVTVVRGTPNGLEKLIQDKIKHSSFTDANHGNVISTGIWNDGTVWRALSIDGRAWEFDMNLKQWVGHKSMAA